MDRASHSLWNAKDVARLLALVENERRYFAEITADLPISVAIISADLQLLLTNRAFQAQFRLKKREELATRLTDLESGAEMVIGSHPHVVEEHEKYMGKYIYYSVGNFVFDQYWNDEVSHGLLVDARFTSSGTESVHEIPVELLRDKRTCTVSLEL